MNQADTNNETITIEDLAAQNADEIKGGPNPKTKRFVVLQSSVAGEADDDTSGNLSSNHNETVNEDNETDESEAAQLNDLTVNDEAEAEIKGGWFTVYQKRAKRAE